MLLPHGCTQRAAPPLPQHGPGRRGKASGGPAGAADPRPVPGHCCAIWFSLPTSFLQLLLTALSWAPPCPPIAPQTKRRGLGLLWAYGQRAHRVPAAAARPPPLSQSKRGRSLLRRRPQGPRWPLGCPRQGTQAAMLSMTGSRRRGSPGRPGYPSSSLPCRDLRDQPTLGWVRPAAGARPIASIRSPASSASQTCYF